MNRRQFLTGASAIAVSAALPAVPQVLTLNGVEIAFDLAAGPDRTALWVIGMYEQEQQRCVAVLQRQIVDSIYNNDYGHGGLAALFRDVEVVTDYPPCAHLSPSKR